MALLFANNASSTLAGPINNSATSVNLASGGGALFPVITGGNYFVMTFVDAATGLINEIVHVTARTGDVLTIVRAQEGTSAQSWLAGDIASNLWTAGQAAAMQQVGQFNSINDTGGANAIAISPTPSLAAYGAGPIYTVKLANSITGASTINVSGLGNIPLLRADGLATQTGDGYSGNFIQIEITSATQAQILGTSFSQVQSPVGFQYITASGSSTVTVPKNATRARVKAWGAGGGGGGSYSTSSAGAGGGGGAYVEAILSGLAAGGTIAATVGAGGAGGNATSSPTAGAAGGDTIFGGYFTAGAGGGGGAGNGAISLSAGAAGTSAYGGAGMVQPGAQGGFGVLITSALVFAGFGGASVGGSQSPVVNQSGKNGVFAGVGGDGGALGGAGGNGANGLIIVEWYP